MFKDIEDISKKGNEFSAFESQINDNKELEISNTSNLQVGLFIMIIISFGLITKLSQVS